MSAILNLTAAKAKYSEVVERVSRSEEIIVAPLATMDVQRLTV
jgi:antitoxin (DNA-binding transcriptional repressor) of toxin-antitoxin stability system